MATAKKQIAVGETHGDAPRIVKYGSHKYDHDWSLAKAASESAQSLKTPHAKTPE